MKLSALIFDMDGVLVDSEPLHLLSMQMFLSRFKIDYQEEDNREFLGRKDLVIAQTLIDRFSLTMTAREFVDCKEELLSSLLEERAQARPGVYEILAEAKEAKIPMAVASSATMATIQLVMRRLNIGSYFSKFCSGEEVVNSKPAPDIFLLAAERLGVAADKCVVIEDTINGLKGAKAAGMYGISVPCAATAHQDHSIADLQLASLSEIQLPSLFGYNSAAG